MFEGGVGFTVWMRGIGDGGGESVSAFDGGMRGEGFLPGRDTEKGAQMKERLLEEHFLCSEMRVET